MDYRVLGSTGVTVTQLCLGTMMFGANGNRDEQDCIRVIHRALDAGINFVDTADIYSRSESEQIVGKAIAGGRRANVVLATKANGAMGPDVNQRGNSRRWLVREVEASLRRLQTDYIDLYQIHRPDPATDIGETLSALSDLISAGKICYAGHSTFPASEIVAAQWAAERAGRARFVCEQPPYSILARGIEAEVLPACQRYDLGVIIWGPLAGGWLSGRYRLGAPMPASLRAARWVPNFDMSLAANEVKLAAADKLATLAAEAGISLIHLAIGFALSHPAVTSVIIGPRTMEHLESQLDAPSGLPAGLLDAIDEIVPPGVNLNPADGGYVAPAIAEPALRRRAEAG
jgi:aryl-alcohol dehydrogenase-like predicted oxidoreductase